MSTGSLLFRVIGFLGGAAGCVGMLLLLLIGLIQLAAGYVGIHHALGTGWALAAIVAGVMFRFTLPLTIGSFFCAKDVWGWPWFGAILFALPGLLLMLLMVPGFGAALLHRWATAGGGHSHPLKPDDSRGNALTRLVRGDFGLARTFWFHFVLVNFLANLLASALEKRSPLATTLVSLAQFTYNFAATLGVWRAAKRYTGPRVWAIGARVLTGIIWAGLVVLFGFLFYAVLFPQLVQPSDAPR